MSHNAPSNLTLARVIRGITEPQDKSVWWLRTMSDKPGFTGLYIWAIGKWQRIGVTSIEIDKIDHIIIDGNGELFLSNDGTYKKVPVVDNLTSYLTDIGLSANQGRILNEKISSTENSILTYINGDYWNSIVNKINNSISIGNSGSADKLSTARKIELINDVTGSTNFDGSVDIKIDAQIAPNTVGTIELMDNSVTTNKIVNNTILVEDLNTTVETWIDDKDFLPFPPKIGYEDDDTQALIYGAYEFALNRHASNWVTSDTKGRDILYYFATDGNPETAPQLFQAIRTSVATGFIYMNDPVRPTWLTDDQVIAGIMGLGNNYIVYQIRNISTNTTERFICSTNGSRNAIDWSNNRSIQTIWATSVPEGYDKVIYVENKDLLIICNVTTTGWIYISTYKYSDLSLVCPRTLIIKLSDIVSQGDLIIMNYSYYANYSCIYNPDDNLLVFALGFGGGVTGSNGISYFHANRIILPFRVHEQFWESNIGLENYLNFELTPLIDFVWNITGGGIASNIGYQGFNITYDSFKKLIWTIRMNHESTVTAHLPTIYWAPSTNRVINYDYFISDSSSVIMTVPDTSRWHKGPGYPCYIYNNHAYFRGYSNKYGTSFIIGEYNKNASIIAGSSDTILVINPGAKDSATIGEPTNFREGNTINTTIIRENINTTRFIWYDIQRVYEIVHNADGSRSITPLSVSIPTIDTTKYTVHNRGYDPVHSKAYFIVTDVTPIAGTETGFGFLLVWNAATNAFTEYRNEPIMDAYWQSGKNSTGRVTIRIPGGFFIDLDGKIYFRIGYTVVGDAYGSGILCADLTLSSNIISEPMNTTTLGTIQIIGSSWTISYDDAFGYHLLRREGQVHQTFPPFLKIMTSKSLDPTLPDYTFAEWLAGSRYSYTIPSSTTEGLVGQLMSNVIFLGGYRSLIPETELPLTANSTNYIYLSRGVDRNTINVEITTAPTGITTSFNKVLICELTTDSEKIINQVNYPVAWNFVDDLTIK